MFGFELCFDYDSEVPSLQAIMARSKRTQWTLEDVKWNKRLRKSDYTRILEWQGVMRSEYVQGLTDKQLETLARQLVAFDFSQILHGEQGAMMLAGQLTNCLDDLDARLFAAGQVRDEARHVEVVRKLIHRIGPIYPCGEVLEKNLGGLLESTMWPKQVLGLQLFLEARAMLSFRQHLLFVDDPVFKDAVLRIERDESQHVAFGIRYMDQGVKNLSEAERTELLEYAAWLDQNVWRMTQPMEYRAPFEEAGLDFTKFWATFRPPSPFSLNMGTDARKSVYAMFGQFKKWFYRALERTGITDDTHQFPALQQVLTTGPDLPPEADDHEILPWVEGGYYE